MATRPRAVDDYLGELARALRDVPSDRRAEIVAEIEAHIDGLLAEHGPSPSDADVRNVLERVGGPEDIAREARDDVDVEPARRRWTDVVAVIALPFPVVGWIVGAVLVWLSDIWSTRDKVIGTIAGPGMFVLGGLAVTADSRSGPVSHVGDEPGIVDAGGDPVALLLVLSLIFLVPVVAAIYLARKLRTRPESNGRAAGSGGQNHDLAGVR